MGTLRRWVRRLRAGGGMRSARLELGRPGPDHAATDHAPADRATSEKPAAPGGRWPAPVLAVIVGFAQVFGTFGAMHGRQAPGRGPPWSQEGVSTGGAVESIDALGIALLLLGPVMLVVRRRYPVATLIVSVAAAWLYLTLGYSAGPFVLAAAVATMGAIIRGHRVAAWITAGAMYLAGFVLNPLLGQREWPSLTEATFFATAYALILVAGELVRIRRVRAAEAVWAQELDQERRLGEERLRIARELHDVVAHNISLINVQAGVALHLLDAQPDQARGALTTIKGASKDALVELRSILGVLRQVDENVPRHSSPTTEQLEQLAERFRTAGVRVEVTIVGESKSLAQPVDLAAYRVVQEALTNVLRHAGESATAWVRIAYEHDGLVVEVNDDGGGTPSAGDELGSGSGIIGMRERVTGLGGELRAGPRDGGGFGVRAVLPYADDAGQGSNDG